MTLSQKPYIVSHDALPPTVIGTTVGSEMSSLITTVRTSDGSKRGVMGVMTPWAGCSAGVAWRRARGCAGRVDGGGRLALACASASGGLVRASQITSFRQQFRPRVHRLNFFMFFPNPDPGFDPDFNSGFTVCFNSAPILNSNPSLLLKSERSPSLDSDLTSTLDTHQYLIASIMHPAIYVDNDPMIRNMNMD
ncbi:hypothetical protein EVAR_19685_1 [Eumeta japonica]|uniref:Uncharacterized protein n=1 Tax=Eumeta variegata TaxID=151549 RepID=A0A4C1V214_EUMVA|nr:hypothetical protein EVAR_19685_1 [Eumeta japonica]